LGVGCGSFLDTLNGDKNDVLVGWMTLQYHCPTFDLADSGHLSLCRQYALLATASASAAMWVIISDNF
jgi:hypothetical protein